MTKNELTLRRIRDNAKAMEIVAAIEELYRVCDRCRKVDALRAIQACEEIYIEAMHGEEQTVGDCYHTLYHWDIAEIVRQVLMSLYSVERDTPENLWKERRDDRD